MALFALLDCLLWPDDEHLPFEQIVVVDETGAEAFDRALVQFYAQ